MNIYHEITPKLNTAIALGFFDGIHLGHREIVKKLIKEAKLLRTNSAIVSFDTIPANSFSEQKILAIQSLKDKEIILDSIGVDFLYELAFEKYKEMTAYEYLRDVLIANFKPPVIIVGYNHSFGKNKEGNVSFLKEHEEEFGYRCIVVPEIKVADLHVSSSTIRKEIQNGNLELVKAMLGRYFSIRNSVIKGNKIARTFGYPTANLIWSSSLVKLPYGVYFGYAQIERDLKPALISWGKKPTLTKGEDEILEAHIYGFDKEIYGKIVNILFEKKIRNEIHFPGLKQLTDQINKDYTLFKQWVTYNQKTTFH